MENCGSTLSRPQLSLGYNVASGQWLGREAEMKISLGFPGRNRGRRKRAFHHEKGVGDGPCLEGAGESRLKVGTWERPRGVGGSCPEGQQG